MGTISFEDFARVEIRVGTITEAQPYAQARRPAYKLWVIISAAWYKQIGKFMSEILVLGFPDADGEVVMIGPDQPVPNGGKLY